MGKMIGVDMGYQEDETTVVYTKTPSRFRLWLRKWLLKGETWEWKVVKIKHFRGSK